MRLADVDCFLKVGCFYGPIENELDPMITQEEHATHVAAGTTEDGTDPAAPEEDVESVRTSAVQTEGDVTQDGGDGFSLSRLIQQAAARKRLEQDFEATPPPGSVQKVVVSPRVVVMNEWEVYKAVEVTEETVQRLGRPLAWWRQNQLLYPHLAKLARKYLAVQASTAASERLFSQAGVVVTSNRNRMSGDTAADITILPESIKHKLW